MKKIRVFVVDDSAVVRQVVADLIHREPGLEFAGAAPDPVFAQQKMASHWPDVILLDIEMPRMDGLSFLRKLMRERPTPVVICSTLTEKGAAVTSEALAAGAVDVIAKPRVGLKDFLSESSVSLVRALKAAATARMPIVAQSISDTPTRSPTAPRREKVVVSPGVRKRIVALGASTGGTQALQVVLTGLPEDCPAVLVVQHMPEKFTAAFASRLDGLCACEVKEARQGDEVRPGRVLIAPGGRHMRLQQRGDRYHVDVLDGPPVNRHKPSVDVLFRSVAKVAASDGLGILLTGMGNDGAAGLLAMRNRGAFTIAQDRETSVVYGMPKEAIAMGAAVTVLPLGDMSQAICQ